MSTSPNMIAGNVLNILREPLRLLALSQSCGSELWKSAWQLLDSISSASAFPLRQLLHWEFQEGSSCTPPLASIVKALKAMLPPQELHDLLLECTTHGLKVQTLRYGWHAQQSP